MVSICYYLDGNRQCLQVTKASAKVVRKELEKLGATIYWYQAY